MGASPAGFANNEVIGTLVLDRLTDSAVMRFSGTGPGRAMYVDNLILTNASFSDYRNGLFIDTNTLRIYFANANADPFKLMEVYPGALIWVTNFTGPNSTALVTNLYTGSTCLMNEALYNSAEIGFFGIPNLYNQPYVPNEKGNPAVYAPCPGDASAMTLFISSENVAPAPRITPDDRGQWIGNCGAEIEVRANGGRQPGHVDGDR